VTRSRRREAATSVRESKILDLNTVKYYNPPTNGFLTGLFGLVSQQDIALGGLVVSVLATGPKVRGFKPGRGRWKSVARLPLEGK
jgi:hypothetical protein